MDLDKHAFRLTPMISSDLVADAFELARDIRVLDMRAAPIRARLVGECEGLLAGAGGSVPPSSASPKTLHLSR